VYVEVKAAQSSLTVEPLILAPKSVAVVSNFLLQKMLSILPSSREGLASWQELKM